MTTVPQRAITRDELSRAVREAGFGAIRWLSPSQTGFREYVCIAFKPLEPALIPQRPNEFLPDSTPLNQSRHF